MQLATLLGSGSIAGLVLGGVDTLRASAAVGGWVGLPITSALLGLWIWFGVLLGVAIGLLRSGNSALRRRLPNRLAAHGLLVLVVTGVALLLARKVFSGSGIRQTHAGSWGPWLVAGCAAFGVGLAVRLLSHGAVAHRWWLCVLALTFAGAALVLDARLFFVTLFARVLLLVTALALIFFAIELARVRQFVRYGTLGLALLTLPSLLAFPSSRAARELFAQSSWAGLQLIEYAKFHVDFDHDGYSPIFGGGDCDDANPAAYPGAPERPADGRDFDCDGLDDPKPSGLSFRPFQTQSSQAAREIAIRAKQFPTIVILIDALRYDRVGDARFPNLALLARESIRYTHAYSVSATTLTSVPAMMNGQVGSERGRDDIARALGRAGQSSAFIAPDVVTNHFQQLGKQNPVLDFSATESIPTNYSIGWGAGDTVPTSQRLTAATTAKLDSAEPPSLIWLHYFDVHQWNVLEQPGLPEHGDAARYDAVLQRLDESLRPLIERRERLNLVLIADHGEALGARGLRFHTSFVFQELAHIPLLVRVPGTAPDTIDTAVGSPGVFNLLRALRGLEPEPIAADNLLALVGAKDVGDGPGFASFDNAQWALLFGNHRLLYMPHQQLVELYDVDRDPLEKSNQADDNPELASAMLARLFELRNQRL